MTPTKKRIRAMLSRDYEGQPLPSHVIASPKLDGVRCLYKNGQLVSRTNYVFLCLRHILDALDTDLILDGELYCGSLDFFEISGLVRRESAIPDTLKIEFHIFDVYHPSLPFTERLKLLASLPIDGPIKLVPHTQTPSQEIESVAKVHVRNGFEGVCFREPDSLYSCDVRQTWRIKPSFIERHIITGVTDTPKAKGLAIIQFDKFSATLNASVQSRNYFFRNPPIGRTAIVKHWGITNTGLPRQPKVLHILSEKEEQLEQLYGTQNTKNNS